MAADDATTRVARLERRCRLQGYGLAALAALTAASWAFPRRAEPPPAPKGDDMPELVKGVDVAASRIVASRIEILGDKGQTLATLDGKGGFGTLDLRTDRGGWGTRVNSNGLTCVDSRGRSKAGIAAVDTSGGSLFLHDEEGKSSVDIYGGDAPAMVLGGDDDQGGVLQFGVRGGEPHMEYHRAGEKFEKVLP